MNDETPSACELQCQTFRLAGVRPGCERATIALLCFILAYPVCYQSTKASPRWLRQGSVGLDYSLGPIPIETASSGCFGSACPSISQFIALLKHRCIWAPWGLFFKSLTIRNIPALDHASASPPGTGSEGGVNPASLRAASIRFANGGPSVSSIPRASSIQRMLHIGYR